MRSQGQYLRNTYRLQKNMIYIINGIRDIVSFYRIMGHIYMYWGRTIYRGMLCVYYKKIGFICVRKGIV